MISINLSYYAMQEAVETYLVKELHIPVERLQHKGESLVEIMIEFNDHDYKADDNGDVVVDKKAPKKKRYLHYGDDVEILVNVEGNSQ
jgi:hypothetical protein